MFGNMTDIEAAVKTEMIVELKEILAADFDSLVDSFIKDAHSRMTKLQQAIAASNCEVVRAEAHSLKGSSLNLGALLFPQLCSELEDQGKAGDLEGSEGLFGKIKSEFARVESELHDHTLA
ncbi:MAG: HPt (histidine-containing phosphotransfer) domain-containing protein [Pseudohongiellaceae bacterium]|jgi:HPt (histidine-containing phosphotransfer) domain-containing protein